MSISWTKLEIEAYRFIHVNTVICLQILSKCDKDAVLLVLEECNLRQIYAVRCRNREHSEANERSVLTRFYLIGDSNKSFV